MRRNAGNVGAEAELSVRASRSTDTPAGHRSSAEEQQAAASSAAPLPCAAAPPPPPPLAAAAPDGAAAGRRRSGRTGWRAPPRSSPRPAVPQGGGRGSCHRVDTAQRPGSARHASVSDTQRLLSNPCQLTSAGERERRWASTWGRVTSLTKFWVTATLSSRFSTQCHQLRCGAGEGGQGWRVLVCVGSGSSSRRQRLAGGWREQEGARTQRHYSEGGLTGTNRISPSSRMHSVGAHPTDSLC